ncbi:FixH family protein [Brumimicrobium oceani]|uniref:Nitrogen fixation protein FixH n=1 Tax=Brumimicrobium oceani TaxID=2100725 RepID=A0A2U2XF58_9FLAO|nr:FixH family protein [Brumimicrobium oceani]PWH86341.1 hypothetical protein DIT68_03630 [Brumimicrobium oceani]
MNWGHGITIALIAFISYIVYMGVVLMSKDTQLVTPDYYKDEVQFEREINAQQNAIKNKSDLALELSENGVFIRLNTPDEVELLDINLYRPNAKDGDISIASKGKSMFIDKSELESGKYYVTAEWKAQNESYQMRDTLWIP